MTRHIPSTYTHNMSHSIYIYTWHVTFHLHIHMTRHIPSTYTHDTSHSIYIYTWRVTFHLHIYMTCHIPPTYTHDTSHSIYIYTWRHIPSTYTRDVSHSIYIHTWHVTFHLHIHITCHIPRYKQQALNIIQTVFVYLHPSPSIQITPVWRHIYIYIYICIYCPRYLLYLTCETTWGKSQMQAGPLVKCCYCCHMLT